MAFSVQTMKTYPNGKLDCLKEVVNTRWGTTEDYIDCEFIPDSNYPDLSRINIQSTTTGWFYNYEEFVPKVERLFLDLLFILGIFLFFYGLFKFVKKKFILVRRIKMKKLLLIILLLLGITITYSYNLEQSYELNSYDMSSGIKCSPYFCVSPVSDGYTIDGFNSFDFPDFSGFYYYSYITGSSGYGLYSVISSTGLLYYQVSVYNFIDGSSVLLTGYSTQSSFWGYNGYDNGSKVFYFSFGQKYLFFDKLTGKFFLDFLYDVSIPSSFSFKPFISYFFNPTNGLYNYNYSSLFPGYSYVVNLSHTPFVSIDIAGSSASISSFWYSTIPYLVDYGSYSSGVNYQSTGYNFLVSGLYGSGYTIFQTSKGVYYLGSGNCYLSYYDGAFYNYLDGNYYNIPFELLDNDTSSIVSYSVYDNGGGVYIVYFNVVSYPTSSLDVQSLSFNGYIFSFTSSDIFNPVVSYPYSCPADFLPPSNSGSSSSSDLNSSSSFNSGSFNVIVNVIISGNNLSSGSFPSNFFVSSTCPVSGGSITSFLNFGVGGWNILGFKVPEYKPLENFTCLGNLVIWSLTPGSVFNVGIDFSGNNVIDVSNWGDLNNYSGPGLGDVLLWILMFSIGFGYLVKKSRS